MPVIGPVAQAKRDFMATHGARIDKEILLTLNRMDDEIDRNPMIGEPAPDGSRIHFGELNSGDPVVAQYHLTGGTATWVSDNVAFLYKDIMYPGIREGF